MRPFTERSILRLNALERIAQRIWQRIWRRRIKRFRRRRSTFSDADHCDVPAQLASEHVANCRVYADRNLMLADWPAGARIAEISTFKGEFATLILNNCRPHELHLFDLDTSHVARHPDLGSDPKVVLRQGESSDELGNLPDCYFDVIYIDATQPAFLVRETDPIGFSHVDCDVYSSTRTVLDLTASRLAEGAVIVFDEFFNYKGYEQHEFKALSEFVEQFAVKYHFIGYSGQQVSVVVDSVDRSRV